MSDLCQVCGPDKCSNPVLVCASCMLAESIVPLDDMAVAATAERNIRQSTVRDWAIRSFGAELATNPSQRALRFLEEAIELYQAFGGDIDKAHGLVEFIYARPPGTIQSELGGVGVTLLALAAASGYSADLEERREIERITSLPPEHFAERDRMKNAAGFCAPRIEDSNESK